jgi:hypothetical protein
MGKIPRRAHQGQQKSGRDYRWGVQLRSQFTKFPISTSHAHANSNARYAGVAKQKDKEGNKTGSTVPFGSDVAFA